MSRIAISDRHRGRTPWTLDELQSVAKVLGLEVGDLVARPKGFEPLTFWLGADHSLTGWQEATALGAPWNLFCDDCGASGPVHEQVDNGLWLAAYWHGRELHAEQIERAA